MPSEIRGREIEIRKGDTLVLLKADAWQLLREHRRVPNQDDGELVRVQVKARDTLDVVRRHGIHTLAECLQLVQIQAVEHRVQHLQGYRARRLDRQRKVAGQVSLGIRELALGDTFPLKLREFLHDEA